MTSQIKKVIIVGIATHQNQFSSEWEQSLKRFGYKYKILCEGVPWTDFSVKLKGSLDFIETQSDDTILVFVDVYDLVFVVSGSSSNRKMCMKLEH